MAKYFLRFSKRQGRSLPPEASFLLRRASKSMQNRPKRLGRGSARTKEKPQDCWRRRSQLYGHLGASPREERLGARKPQPRDPKTWTLHQPPPRGGPQEASSP